MKNAINIQELIRGKVTYPSWSTNSQYPLNSELNGNKLSVFYTVKGNRKICRTFPKKIILTPKLAYVFGLIKGEGANSLGKSNYRRFTITNSEYGVIHLVLDALDKTGLYRKSSLIDKSIHLIHFIGKENEVIDYWSKCLDIPKEKFKCFEDKTKTSKYGVCHVYVSDVLLRRIVDLIQEELSS